VKCVGFATSTTGVSDIYGLYYFV